ncbi:hypothetical protein ACQKPE_23490 [Pseudomonas sp. NPDC089554]|uniref:hypothetical protein n=1 Tax=Pseudomonas sp. NPDC089554 TaxID=3390653 RepID=UPI003D08FA3C
MENIQGTANWIGRHSFIGKIYALVDGERLLVSPTYTKDGLTLANITEVGGWLQVGGGEDALSFIFRFQDKTQDHYHFKLSMLDKRTKAVDISRNSYLGYYEGLGNRPDMKFEPLEWGENTLRCRWRDSEGREVKAHSDVLHSTTNARNLVAGEGIEQQYLIERIR